MAWIDVIDPRDAQGALSDLYGKGAERNGSVDRILTVHSLNPPSLRAHLDLYKVVMYGRSELTRARREMVGVVVSAANECHY